jgi:enoyl-CoA hydratase
MSWKITPVDHYLIVEMNSNPVNKMNPEFYQDLHDCFDTIEGEYPNKPVILTSTGSTFSAGLDFNLCFPLFHTQDLAKISEWWELFRPAILRVFYFDGPLIAAVNGHAFAGGLILALCGDFRIGVHGAKFSLNEVPIGIPMPSVCTEMIRYRLGSATASDSILTGKVYSSDKALDLKFFQELADPSNLIDQARRMASTFHPNTIPAFRRTKRTLMHPFRKMIDQESPALDRETLKVICHEQSIEAQKAMFRKLKEKHG